MRNAVDFPRPKVKLGQLSIRISVIITSYNYGRFIGETLKSIQSLSHQDWEAIVVDDGSTDNSLSVIRDFADRDPRIRLYQHNGGVNRGIAATNLLALSKCTTDIVAFCESDDVLLPTSFERRLQLMEKYPEVVCCFSPVLMTDADLNPGCTYGKLDVAKEVPFDAMSIACLSLIVTTFSCAMVRTEKLRRCNFNTPYDSCLDLWLFRQLAAMGPFCYVDEVLTLFRKHGNGATESRLSSRAFWHGVMRQNDRVIQHINPRWRWLRYWYLTKLRLMLIRRDGLFTRLRRLWMK